jgi:hypothetical protein
MSRPTRIEVDCSTGIETIIELTDAEIAQMEADAAAYAVRKQPKKQQQRSSSRSKGIRASKARRPYC